MTIADGTKRFVIVRERPTECVTQPVRLISADRTHNFHQLIPTSATHTHTYARIYRLTASRRIISFFIHHYTRISPLVAPNTPCPRGSRSQMDRNFLCFQKSLEASRYVLVTDPSHGSYFKRRLKTLTFLILILPVPVHFSKQPPVIKLYFTVMYRVDLRIGWLLLQWSIFK